MYSLIPHLSISTDIIVGFPTESEEDFLDTLDVLEKVQFDTLYSFIYSSRPHTEAAKWIENKEVGEIDEEEAKRRLILLKDKHRDILTQNNQKELNNIHSILFESYDEQNKLLEGRSDTNKLIRVKAGRNLVGEICKVKISEIKGAQLIGELM